MHLNATQLAERLGVTKGRVSQYVSAGQLNGCYEGDGRDRRFDLDKCLAALRRGLDPAQMLGNGAQTRRTIAGLQHEGGEDRSPAPAVDRSSRRDGRLPDGDADRYELARAAKAEEDLRAMRLRNGRDEGLYVLASEVERATVKMLSQELSEMESVLREGARGVADKLGVDFRTVRQILTDVWREHRAKRSAALGASAASSDMTAAEQDADI